MIAGRQGDSAEVRGASGGDRCLHGNPDESTGGHRDIALTGWQARERERVAVDGQCAAARAGDIEVNDSLPGVVLNRPRGTAGGSVRDDAVSASTTATTRRKTDKQHPGNAGDHTTVMPKLFPRRFHSAPSYVARTKTATLMWPRFILSGEVHVVKQPQF